MSYSEGMIQSAFLDTIKRPTDSELERTWDRYHRKPTHRNKNLVIEAHLFLVKIAVLKMKGAFPAHVDPDDLFQEACIGLIASFDRFDPDKGFRFSTFASFRIEGAIKDYLRRLDPLTYSDRQSAKIMLDAEAHLLTELQREPTSQEICDLLGWSLAELDLVRVKYTSSSPSSMSLLFVDDEHSVEFAEPEDVSLPDHSEVVHLKDIESNILQSLSFLEEYQKIVLDMVINQGLSYSKASEALGISSSEFSELYRHTIEEIRDKLAGSSTTSQK